MFTKEQIKEIEYKLSLLAKKDTQFKEAVVPLRGDETIAFVQGNTNVQLDVGRLVDNMMFHGISDFLNITTKYNLEKTNLEGAINSLNTNNSKIGQVICFLNTEDTWEFYQFIDQDLGNFLKPEYWKPLIRIHFKGLYNSEDILKTLIKIPEIGNYAYVRNEDKYYLYQCSEYGKWENVGDLLSLITNLHITGDIEISPHNTWIIDGVDTGVGIYPKNFYWEQIADRPLTWESLDKLLGGDYIFALKKHTHDLSDISGLQDLIENNFKEELNKKADKDHLHDDRYSNLGHTHDDRYAKYDIDTAVRNIKDAKGNPLFNPEGIVIPNTGGGGGGEGGGTSDIHIITTEDETPPTNENVFSSLKSLSTFLRKDRPDVAQHKIDFLSGITVGDYIDSIYYGKGAAIDKDGNAQIESLEVRSYLKVLELIYNRLNAVEGDQVFTESGIIDKILNEDEGEYTLQLRERWDGDFTAFQVHDVLRGVVNTLDSTGEIKTSWARVTDVDRAANQIKIVLYKDLETPGKSNSEVTKSMVLHRWGNAVDEKRQSTWYISSTEGRVVFLTGVTKPILEDYNYASFWGKPLPLKIFEGKPINMNHPYAYMRGLLVQDLIRVDYNGVPIITVVNKGPWKAGEVYNDGSKPPYIQHDVYHEGVIWRCIIDETIEEPKFNSSAWAVMGDNTRFSVELYTDAPLFYRPNTEFKYDLVAKVFHGTEDITEQIREIDWRWSRDSNNVGNDNAWNNLHANSTNKIVITEKDMGDPLSGITSFTCEVYIKDNDSQYKIAKKIEI